jgi:hypothetical protein
MWASSSGGDLSRPKSIVKARGRTYRWHRVEKRRREFVASYFRPSTKPRELVDVTTGIPALHVTGCHFQFKAGTQVVRSDGSTITLPARGRKAGNAVMTAVDESGTVLIHYRLLARNAFSICGQRLVEVVVSQEGRSVPGIELLVAATADCLLGYITVPSSGGG